jgi:hypothetical protein
VPAAIGGGKAASDGADTDSRAGAGSRVGAGSGAEPVLRGVVRLIDDFLFGSTEASECEDFLRTMHGGFPEYGCEANEEKSRAAPTLALGAQLAGSVRTAGHHEPLTGQTFFAWCGLLIGTRGPMVQKDYSALAGKCVTGDLRFDTAHATGVTLAAKLRQTLVVRCHPIFADPRLTDDRTALLNLYQSCVFVALRLVALSRHLPHVNQAFLTQLALAAIGFAARLLARARARGAEGRGQDAGVYARATGQAEWLGLTAFRRVLGRRQPSMRRVIERLDATLRTPRMVSVWGTHAELLRAASDERLQSARPLRDAMLR